MTAHRDEGHHRGALSVRPSVRPCGETSFAGCRSHGNTQQEVLSGDPEGQALSCGHSSGFGVLFGF